MFTQLLREQTSWEKLGNSRKPIVLYGTGNGADAVLDEFERLGIKIAGVGASEGFVRKRDFRGFTVKSIADFEQEMGDFVIAVGFATSVPQVMNYIKELMKKHEVLMPVVPVFGETIFSREYVENNIDTLNSCRELLRDEESKRVFDNFVYFHYTGELRYLFETESQREEALTNILKLTDKEHMLDLGAYRGDTVEELISLCGGYSRVTAVEPDPKTFRKLQEYAEGKENITLLNCAVWNEQTNLSFQGGGGRQSALSNQGKISVDAFPVDTIVGERKITYVKMDVEGAEKQALEGMKKLARTQKPKLSISAYHRTEDLLTLIPLIHNLNPDYHIYLRHHPYIPCWDTNLYCV
ncbi:MAG: FkbM family methyltransferase [Clostridia bacterium]|nr:FkbM family methyltransferase [Clostridia bacterium]